MGKKKMMRRAVKVISPLNKGKIQSQVIPFMKHYRQIVNYFIIFFWSHNIFYGLFGGKGAIESAKKKFPGVTVRLLQCAAKQALENVKSQRKKPKWKRNMPRMRRYVAVLDQRIWKFSKMTTSFSWLVIGLKNPYFYLPFKCTGHLNAWIEQGWVLSKSTRLKYDLRILTVCIDFIVEKIPPPKRKKGSILGGDQGYIDLLRTSDGQVIGENIKTLIEKFAKRQKHTFIQAKQQAFHVLKTLNLSNVKLLVLEDLNSVKSGKRGKFSRMLNRRLSHWLYAKVRNWLKQYCEMQGIKIMLVNPAYTSQYCPFCNNWDKRNRKGKVFQCRTCGLTEDANTHASKNMKFLGLAGLYSIRLPKQELAEKPRLQAKFLHLLTA